jgi:sodium-dependent dicarboxylate transporter 2/3/5
VLAVVLLLLNKPEIKEIDGVEEYVAAERAKLGSFSRAERNTLIAFAVTVSLWILPGIVALVAGSDSSAYETASNRLDEGVVAVLGASLLFLLPTDWSKREFSLNWSDAARIDWGTILLFGTGIIFGSLLADTGLAETIGKSSSEALGLSTIVAVTAFAIVLAIVVSETTSNTASAAVVVPSSRSRRLQASTRSSLPWPLRSRRPSVSCSRCRRPRMRSSTARAWCRSRR